MLHDQFKYSTLIIYTLNLMTQLDNFSMFYIHSRTNVLIRNFHYLSMFKPFGKDILSKATQFTFTYSKLTTETLEKGVKYVQS